MPPDDVRDKGRMSSSVRNRNQSVTLGPLSSSRLGRNTSNISRGVQPLQLIFQDLTYTVKAKPRRHPAAASTVAAGTEASEEQHPPIENNRDEAGGRDFVILKGLTGVCQPGRLTAIMGPSGAGKTSIATSLTNINKLRGATVNLQWEEEIDKKSIQEIHSLLFAE